MASRALQYTFTYRIIYLADGVRRGLGASPKVDAALTTRSRRSPLSRRLSRDTQRVR